MKGYLKRLFIGAVAVLFSAGSVLAHSLAVVGNATPPAPLAGSNSLQITYDDTTQLAFVQDDTPNGETVYRGSFLINPDEIDLQNPSRILLFEAFGPTTAANTCQPSCPAFWPVISIYLAKVFPTVVGGQYGVQGWLWGNLGGPAAITGGIGGGNIHLITRDDSSRVCFEYETGAPGTMRIAVVDGATACPSTYTAERTTFNGQTQIDFIRFGGPGQYNTGNFSGGSSTIYLDDFQSFRTFAP